MKVHLDGTLPTKGEIFVFGSNLSGIHGAGAAKVARQLFGAVWGAGVGICGHSYAIPTKDKEIVTLPLKEVKEHIKTFNEYALFHSNKEFWLTRVGCGLAGFKDEEIAPLFMDLKNVNYPKDWVPFIPRGR